MNSKLQLWPELVTIYFDHVFYMLEYSNSSIVSDDWSSDIQLIASLETDWSSSVIPNILPRAFHEISERVNKIKFVQTLAKLKQINLRSSSDNTVSKCEQNEI